MRQWGKLFEQATKDALELTITQRIWGAIQEVVIAIANIFGLTDEEIYEAVIYKSDELAQVWGIYKLKLAS